MIDIIQEYELYDGMGINNNDNENSSKEEFKIINSRNLELNQTQEIYSSTNVLLDIKTRNPMFKLFNKRFFILFLNAIVITYGKNMLHDFIV